MQTYRFTVVIEKDEDGRFLAVCPGLQGCYTEGETEAEARSLIEDAIRLHLEERQISESANQPYHLELTWIESSAQWTARDETELTTAALTHGETSYPESAEIFAPQR